MTEQLTLSLHFFFFKAPFNILCCYTVNIVIKNFLFHFSVISVIMPSGNCNFFFFYFFILFFNFTVLSLHFWKCFPHSSVGKESACNAGELGSILGSGRYPGEENGNPLQYSCLEIPMDRGAWWATVHGVARIGHRLVTKPPPYIYKLNSRTKKCVSGEVCFYHWHCLKLPDHGDN